jgi:hypothetical protein
LLALLEAIQRAMALLSEDDLVYVKFRRDTEAHIWQDSYRPRPGGKKARRPTQNVFGHPWPLPQLNERIDQLLRSVDERALAVDLARRLLPVVPEVVTACRRS